MQEQLRLFDPSPYTDSEPEPEPTPQIGFPEGLAALVFMLNLAARRYNAAMHRLNAAHAAGQLAA